MPEDASGFTNMGTEAKKRLTGFAAIGMFFVFGATMAAYAAVTLLKPGTVLDGLWALNPAAHSRLATLGKLPGLGFALLSIFLGAASVGWFRRRYWGWLLGTTIVAINAAGDLINLVAGEYVKGAVGVAIAGIVLFHLTRSNVRKYFPPGSSPNG